MGRWPSYKYDLAGNSAWVTGVGEVLLEGEHVLLQQDHYIKSFSVTTRWVDFASEYSTWGGGAIATVYYTDRRIIWEKGRPGSREGKIDFYFIPYEIVERVTVTPADSIFFLSGLKNSLLGKTEVYISAVWPNRITITCSNRRESKSALAAIRTAMPELQIRRKWKE